jgi:hypothetical protein
MRLLLSDNFADTRQLLLGTSTSKYDKKRIALVLAMSFNKSFDEVYQFNVINNQCQCQWHWASTIKGSKLVESLDLYTIVKRQRNIYAIVSTDSLKLGVCTTCLFQGLHCQTKSICLKVKLRRPVMDVVTVICQRLRLLLSCYL